MADQELSANLQQLVDEILGEMTEWQAQHPEATLAEIERELAARLPVLRAQLLQEMLMGSRQTDADQHDDQTKRGTACEDK